MLNLDEGEKSNIEIKQWVKENLTQLFNRKSKKPRDESTVYSGRDSYPAKWPLNPDSSSRKC